MLIGEFNTPLGAKNRIAVPKSLREQLLDNLVISRGFERSLIIMDLSRWHNLLDSINQQTLLKSEVREIKRYLLGGAYNINLDKQGRFVIPEPLVNFAALSAEITVVGVGEWVEIWNNDNWKQKVENLSKNSSKVADLI